jgi:hypothetical protein
MNNKTVSVPPQVRDIFEKYGLYQPMNDQGFLQAICPKVFHEVCLPSASGLTSYPVFHDDNLTL